VIAAQGRHRPRDRVEGAGPAGLGLRSPTIDQRRADRLAQGIRDVGLRSACDHGQKAFVDDRPADGGNSEQLEGCR